MKYVRRCHTYLAPRSHPALRAHPTLPHQHGPGPGPAPGHGSAYDPAPGPGHAPAPGPVPLPAPAWLTLPGPAPGPGPGSRSRSRVRPGLALCFRPPSLPASPHFRPYPLTSSRTPHPPGLPTACLDEQARPIRLLAGLPRRAGQRPHRDDQPVPLAPARPGPRPRPSPPAPCPGPPPSGSWPPRWPRCRPPPPARSRYPSWSASAA
jgi:hypothetical protein